MSDYTGITIGWGISTSISHNTVRGIGLPNYSDGKADPLLVECLIDTPYSRGMIHFFHPGLVKHSGASTLLCRRDEPPRSIFDCKPIGKTALDLGIITSLIPCTALIADGCRVGLPNCLGA
jgi:hypothetical protein